MNTINTFLRSSWTAFHCMSSLPAMSIPLFEKNFLFREFSHGLKSKKSVTKRFDLTGTGKLKYNKAGRRHGNSNKTREYLRDAKQARYLESGEIYKSLKGMIF